MWIWDHGLNMLAFPPRTHSLLRVDEPPQMPVENKTRVWSCKKIPGEKWWRIWDGCMQHGCFPWKNIDHGGEDFVWWDGLWLFCPDLVIRTLERVTHTAPRLYLVPSVCSDLIRNGGHVLHSTSSAGCFLTFLQNIRCKGSANDDLAAPHRRRHLRHLEY